MFIIRWIYLNYLFDIKRYLYVKAEWNKAFKKFDEIKSKFV